MIAPPLPSPSPVHHCNSNICTAQALLANMAAMYAVYHGPEGIRAIAQRIHALTALLARGIRGYGHDVESAHGFFDTLAVRLAHGTAASVMQAATAKGINLRRLDEARVGISLCETVTRADMEALLALFVPPATLAPSPSTVLSQL
jgi:glycine dehydrogenase